MGSRSLSAVQREFWRGLAEKLSRRTDTPLYVDPEHVADPKNWVPQHRNLPSEVVHYSLVTNTVQGYLQVKLQIEGDEIFEFLRERRAEIESEISPALEWSPGEAYDTVILEHQGDIRADRGRWEEYHDWFVEYGELFDSVFGSHIRTFDG